MRIAFCGKGGSGKSTVSSLFARYLASKKLPVLVMDGDINQHVGRALGFSDEELKSQKKLGGDEGVLHDYVRGSNSRIPSSEFVSQHTPPGQGSNLMHFSASTPVSEAYELEKNGVRFISLGGHSEEQVGATCFHTFTHKMGTYLNHLIDNNGEYFIGDMCAGADPFTCSLATKFDAVFLVVEPTEKSVGVFDQCKKHGDPYDVKIFVIGNKIEDEDDLDFIKSHVGDALVGHISRSDFVRKQEKGKFQDITALESENTELLQKIQEITDGLERDWDVYLKNNLHFFERAADSWADKVYGTNFRAQVDPDFRYQDYINATSDQQKAA